MAPLLIMGGLMAIAISLSVGYLAGRFLVRSWRKYSARRPCWHCEARKCLTRKGADGRCRRCWKRWSASPPATYMKTFYHNSREG